MHTCCLYKVEEVSSEIKHNILKIILAKTEFRIKTEQPPITIKNWQNCSSLAVIKRNIDT